MPLRKRLLIDFVLQDLVLHSTDMGTFKSDLITCILDSV